MRCAKLRTPVAAALAAFALILGAQAVAGAVPPGWQGNWAAQAVRGQADFIARFFPFDALWYERIAADAYAWDASAPHTMQDVAFFPLWPLVLRASGARWAAVGMAACFAIASVVAFQFLARRVLPPGAAARATWLFALWPGASFLLLSYPTGLANLLGLLALLGLLRNRIWIAAVCAGVMTASGPLGLGTAAAVWVCGVRARWRGRVSAGFVGFAVALGIVAVSGLLGFVAWLAWKFDDPFAFVAAQRAWAEPVPALARIPRAIWQLLVLPDFVAALRFAAAALRARTLVAAQAGAESAIHSATLGLDLLMLWLSRRVAPLPVLLQGAFTLLLFVWFHSASRPGNSTLRLTYCVFTTFMGLAWMLRNRNSMGRWVLAGFATLLAGGAFLSAAGYHVV